MTTNNKQPEALLYADILENKIPSMECLEKAAAELRRLHEVNAELVEALQVAKKSWGNFIPPANSNALKAWDMVNTAIAKAIGEQP